MKLTKTKAQERFHRIFSILMFVSVIGVVLIVMGNWIGLVLFSSGHIGAIFGDHLDRKYKTREFMDGY